MQTHMTQVPRPEHPRPDFERADWLNLNGIWEFCYDPDDRGREDHYALSDQVDFPERILVPFAWQSELSGQHRTDYRGIVWYRRHVELPDAWQGQRIFLRFGAVDYFTEVWVNGQPAGSHEGGYTSFEFDITPCLQPGKNLIVVRVEDPPNLYEIPHGKQASLPPDPWQQFSFSTSSGIWQTVWLEARPVVHIHTAFFTPDVLGEAVDIRVPVFSHEAWQGRLNIQISAPDGTVLQASVAGQGEASTMSELSVHISIPAPQLWDIHAPNLYQVKLKLEAGTGQTDEVSSYFGMRQIEQHSGQIWLNGRPIYLMTALDQGYWPQGLYTAPSDEALRADVAYSKAIGLNGLRKHLKIEDPRFNYWADQLGLLIWCDMPCPTLFNETACQRFHYELMAMVERDYNHPSIILWCPYNETWGLEFSLQHDRSMQDWVSQLYDELKAMDPRRLVVDNSGWSHVKTDLADFHYYTANQRDWRRKMSIYDQSPDETGVFSFKLMADGLPYDGTPLVVSEFGYGWEHDSAWSLRWSMNELRRHPRIVGFTYCELYDVEYEYCGYALYDRRPKQFGYDLNMVNSEDYVVLDYTGALSVLPDDVVRIPVLYSAYAYPAIPSARLHWELRRVTPEQESGALLRQGSFEFAVQPYTVTPVGEISFSVPDTRGPVQLTAWVEAQDGKHRALNMLDFEIFNPTQSFFQQTETEDTLFVTLSMAPGNKSISFWNEGDHVLGQWVDDRAEAIWFEGAGRSTFRTPVISRQGFPPILSGITLFMELGSRPAKITQSVEGQDRPSDVTISLNGITLKTLRLRDLKVSAQGALTRIHNSGVGEHGEMVRIEVPQDLIEPIVVEALAKGYITLDLEVKADAEYPGGLTIFGSRAGRYAIDPSIRIAVPKMLPSHASIHQPVTD